jgi:hypothetical protein
LCREGGDIQLGIDRKRAKRDQLIYILWSIFILPGCVGILLLILESSGETKSINLDILLRDNISVVVTLWGKYFFILCIHS